MVKIKDTQFCVKNLKIKRTIFFDPPEWGFEPQIFSNFLAHDLTFHQSKSEGDESDSRQGR
jgi:hypothetical protein